MKKVVVIIAALLLTSCGSGSSGPPFEPGLYSGDVDAKNGDGLCGQVRRFWNYSVRIAKVTEGGEERLQIDEVLITILGIVDVGVSVRTSSDSSEVEFDDVNESVDFPMEFDISDRGDGTSVHLSCFVPESTVHLSAADDAVHFSATSKLSCVNQTDGGSIECENTEEGELLRFPRPDSSDSSSK